MAVDDSLVLIANPGSASRKYAIYEGEHMRASLHFEHVGGAIACTILHDDKKTELQTELRNLDDVTAQLQSIFHQHELLGADEQFYRIGLRVVAPGGHFLCDRLLDESTANQLRTVQSRAPLHVGPTLHELERLQVSFPGVPVIGISDSAFHSHKPDHAWNYGLPLADADRFEIKRFGYHGLSVASVVEHLVAIDKLPPKVVVAHLGSGASVTAVQNGQSIDTTMGYSPLEGVIMATRSGSLDPLAAYVLKTELKFDDEQLFDYLQHRSGLSGLGGADDIRILLEREADDKDHRATLALDTYAYSIQKAIGQMAAVLGGVDLLVFAGMVGERSAPIRQRVIGQHFHYLELELDIERNKACFAPNEAVNIGRHIHSKPVYVVPANEAAQMVRQTLAYADA